MLQNRCKTSPGGRDEADRHGGNLGGSRRRGRVAVRVCHRAIVIRNQVGAGRAAGYARSAPGVSAADPASGHALLPGARRLSSLLSGTGRSARVQRPLRAGIPAERHGDRAAHELPLDSRLRIGKPIPPLVREKIITAEELRGVRCIHLSGAGIQSLFTSPFLGFDPRVAARLLPSGDSRTALT
jgi:hypothetical protein